ncbi:MAG TPA: nucleoside monophosphate kinase [Candidatus Paceibacterota bacterium]|nr:nucleoside monophosphate kinase [Candidatus Paceibacterota bacterium]HRZ34308.1 nucleoside monophosphate kinase [Candidatus Paceibacterota bacterium]
MNLLTVIFIGRSGCGKGTQIEKLVSFLKANDQGEIFCLETGARFRSFIKSDGYVNDLARAVGDSGGLQPEFLAILMWADEIVKNMKPDQHLILDGVARRINEAKVLDSALDFLKRGRVHLVYLNVSKEWAVDKLEKRGRHDDKASEDINRRMKWFEESVTPVLEHYKSKENVVFHDINGEQSIEDVHEDIMKSLDLK